MRLSIALPAAPIAVLFFALSGCGSRATLLDASGSGAQTSGAGASGETASATTADAAGVGGASGTTTGTPSTGDGTGDVGTGTASGEGTGTAAGGASVGPTSGVTSGSGTSGAGGGGPVCPSFGDECTTCLSRTCSATYCNCYENAECFALFDCTGSCGGDSTCEEGCLAAHQDGISDAILLSDCAGTTCNSSCGWGDDVDPCTECILSDCEQPMNACVADPECLVLFNCLSSCGPVDLTCQQSCYDAHGAGVPTLQALLECSVVECDGSC
jgi:hypothetical protein